MPIGGRKAPLYASALAVPPVKTQASAVSPSLGCYESVLTILKANADYVDQSPTHLTAMETLLQEDPPSMGAAGPDFARMLDTFARSSSLTLKTLALGSGIRRGDIGLLKQLADQSPAIAQSKLHHHVSFAISAWRNPDAEGLTALGRLATQSGENSMTRPAAEALMMIHTKDAVPHLVRLLASKDTVLRGAAIRGLSMFVRGIPILTPENVRTMQYLNEKPSEYWDPGIAPYVTMIPIPPEKEAAFVNAWTSWSNRMAQKFSN